ncbi:MAG: DUF2281 domain-containing protein [Candidatus Sericytochromatia bacterium]
MFQDQQLLQAFHALPPEKQAEVVDFVEFLTHKQQKLSQPGLADATPQESSSLFDLVKDLAGIIKDGTPDLSIQPVDKTPRPCFGSARGLISMSDDFDEPLEDFAEYM